MRLRPAARILFAAAVLHLAEAADPYLQLRERMVHDQLEARGVSDPTVLRVLLATPRHLFVPPDLRSAAYDDRALPIGYGATISQPLVVALMTQSLAVGPKNRVLEIGTGSGYQAAVLAQIASHVFTIEIVPELARSARERFQQLGYRNVTVREGDGYKGWPEAAPFDRIIVTAAPPSVPAALTDQLARGGRMVLPVGATVDQQLLLIEKASDGSLHQKPISAVSFVPMRPGRN